MADTENTFDFELVSPEKKIMSERAWQVTIPGEEGSFGVRSGHSALVSSIRPGVVDIVLKQGDKPKRIFIAGGFADVTASNCTILAEEAIALDDMDAVLIKKEMSDLESKLSAAKDNIEKSRFTKQLALAKSKLAAVSGSIAA